MTRIQSAVKAYANFMARRWIEKHHANQLREPQAVFNLNGRHCQRRLKSGELVAKDWESMTFHVELPAGNVTDLQRRCRILECHVTRGTRKILRSLCDLCSQQNGRLCFLTPSIVLVSLDTNIVDLSRVLAITAYFCIMPKE